DVEAEGQPFGVEASRHGHGGHSGQAEDPRVLSGSLAYAVDLLQRLFLGLDRGSVGDGHGATGRTCAYQHVDIVEGVCHLLADHDAGALREVGEACRQDGADHRTDARVVVEVEVTLKQVAA